MSVTEPATKARDSRPSTRWHVAPPAPPAEVERLVRELGVHPLLAAMLWNRGLREDVRAQLEPPLEPTSIPDLGPAAERLEDALRNRRRILIHGDYDADGVSGSAVLFLGLRALGANVEAFIPNRLRDGYGVNMNRVEEHAERCDLFITVDCGITNLEELARLQELGREVIVTDHHLPGETLPECLIVHPSTSPQSRPGRPELTGAGVAFHLLWALHERMGLEAPLEYSDIATIGTVADVAPLLGENRALVRAGLERMGESNWPGLRACIAQAGLRKRQLTARDVAFVIGPRLNAAGRLGEADKGLELLTTASERRALELAAYLDARNQDRRKIQDEMFEQALELVDVDAPALILDSDAWHPGVMGIVASKLLEQYYKPVFIIAKGKGSVRSTPGISAVKALRAAAEHLSRFGGHAQAAGFAIAPGRTDAFRDAIYRFVGSLPAPQPRLAADVVVSAADVDEELLRAMYELEPYGEGHPAPVLALCDRLDMARAVGRDGATLQLKIGGLRGVAWQKGELAAHLMPGEPVNAAVSLREREWRGKRELEFVAQEVRPLEPFGLAESDLSPAERGPSRLRRGRGPAVGHAPDDEGSSASVCTFRELPLHDDPLRSTEKLRELIAGGSTIYLDLDEAALEAARGRLRQLPTVHDVRRGFVALQRGATLPFEPTKSTLVSAVLVELDLIDGLGRVRRGAKRDPHSSETMMRSLLERYRLGSLLNAYRTFDDEAFEVAAMRLLSSETSSRP